MKSLKHIGLYISITLIVSIVISSCKQGTVVTGTWQKDTDKAYDDLVVAALTDRMSLRTTVEEDLKQSLENIGASVQTSVNVLPPGFIEDENQKAVILNRVNEEGTDGILTIALVAGETETRYEPGGYPYAPYPTHPYYGHFWAYYDHWYPKFATPDYYTENNNYYIETNLYDAQTEELVWSGQSKIYDPAYFERFSESYADEITASMASDGVIQ